MRQPTAEHLNIVHAYAEQLAGVVDHHELCSIGHLALVEAARKWPKFRRMHTAAHFGAYLAQRVKWRMLDAVRRFKVLPQEEKTAGVVKPNERFLSAQSRDQDGCWRRLEAIPDLKESDDDRAHVYGLLARLPQLERRALMLAYGIGFPNRATLAQIGFKLRQSPYAVRALIDSGLMRLRWDAVRGKA